MIELKMTMDELLALPVSVDLVTAGRAFGLGRTRAFELAKADEFPCRVLRVGVKYRVPRSALLEALGVADEPAVPQQPRKPRRRSAARGATRQERGRTDDGDSLPAA